MIEARAFVDSLEPARRILESLGAQSAGVYEIYDEIFGSNQLSIGLEQEFLRLRQIPVNIWPEKPFVLAVKRTQPSKVGKTAYIPIKQQFDRLSEMRKWYQSHLATQYTFDFAFHRTGEQYDLENGDQVDLEINEKWPTIELKSQTQDGLKLLLAQFSIGQEDLIDGPSVVEMKKLLKK